MLPQSQKNRTTNFKCIFFFYISPQYQTEDYHVRCRSTRKSFFLLALINTGPQRESLDTLFNSRDLYKATGQTMECCEAFHHCFWVIAGMSEFIHRLYITVNNRKICPTDRQRGQMITMWQLTVDDWAEDKTKKQQDE